MFAIIAAAARIEPTRRPAFAPEVAPAYVLTGVAAAIDVVLLARHGFTLGGHEFQLAAVLAGLLLLIALCCRARGWARIATLVEIWTLWSAFCVLVMVMTFAIAADAAPLVDPILAEADRRLLPGFDWPATMRALAARPTAMTLANAAYASIRWQPLLLFGTCVLGGRADRCRAFVAAWMTTLFLVVIGFALAPALGAYPHFGVAAAEMPAVGDRGAWSAPALLDGLRDGSLRTLWFVRLEGLVTFPSFHAGAAVLLGWGFWSTPRLRWPAVVLNAAMLLSAVPIGGHYVVDVLGGIAVAAAGVMIARRMEKRDRPAGLAAPSRERATGRWIRRW